MTSNSSLLAHQAFFLHIFTIFFCVRGKSVRAGPGKKAVKTQKGLALRLLRVWVPKLVATAVRHQGQRRRRKKFAPNHFWGDMAVGSVVACLSYIEID